MGALHIKGVTRTFTGNVQILKGIDIEIDPGEFLILVGPSGCGKSTLLSIIAGLDAPTAGRVFIGERDVTDLPAKDRDIAMVFQSYALYPNMNVAQNIAFGLEMRKVPRAEREATVQRVATMLQLGQLLDRKPGQLSGGQRQRVAMGRALARDPKLFLFDEPLSNLDAKLRVEMRAEIKLLHQRTKTTTVYVTHDQVEDDAGRPHRGDEGRPGAAVRHARRHLCAAGHALCRRVHRLALDESAGRQAHHHRHGDCRQ